VGGCSVTAAVGTTGELFVSVSGEAILDFGGGPLASTGGIDLFFARFDAAGMHVWSERYGSAGSDVALVSRGDNSQLWLHGFFDGATLDLGNMSVANSGDYDGFVAKLDPSGAVTSAEPVGGAGGSMVFDVDDRAGNVTATGRFTNDMMVGAHMLSSSSHDDVFVVTFDPSGSVLSAVGFGGNQTQVATGVTHDATGHVLVAGQFNEDFELGGNMVQSAGWVDAFWAAFDAAGSPLGSCTYGAIDGQLISDIEATADGIVFLATFRDNVDFGTGPFSSAGEWDLVLGKFAPVSP
jgi:hypothetical protein